MCDSERSTPGYGYVAGDTTELEETFYYHSDHLGSTSYVTDEDGNITQYEAYLPYGELLVDGTRLQSLCRTSLMASNSMTRRDSITTVQGI